MAELWERSAWWMAWLARSSLQASVLIVLVLAAQWAFRRRLSARWRHALWLLVLLRLLLPAAPAAPWSVHRVVTGAWALVTDARPTDAARPPAEAFEPQAPQGATASLPETAGEETASPSPPVSVPAPAFAGIGPAPASPAPAEPWRPRLLGALVLVWAVVAAGLLARLVAANARLHRALRRRSARASREVSERLGRCAAEMSLRRPVEAWVTPAVRGPALFGLFRPRLLLPEGLIERLSPQELRHVLRHELAHLRRGDVPLDWLATVLSILHWFNPLVWVALRRMRADREPACDEAVLARTADREVASYGQTMLKLLQGLSPPARLPGVVGIVERAGQMKRRIRMIADFRRNRRGRTATAIVLLAVLAAVALTNAEADPPKPAKPAGKAPAAKPEPDKRPAPASAPAGSGDVLKKLSRNIERLSFADVGLKDVVSFLREYSGANIYVNWPALETGKVGPGTLITVDVRNISVKRALEMVLRDASGMLVGGSGEAGYVTVGGVVVVSTRRNLDAGDRVGGEVRPWTARPNKADADLRKKLGKSIQKLHFAEIPLKDVMQFLREYSEANIHVRWRSLAPARISQDTKISMNLRNVTVRQALEMVLRDAGGRFSGSPAAYAIDEGVLLVSTYAELARRRESAYGRSWFTGVTVPRPGRSRTLSFVRAGKIAKISVKEGDAVKAGQELVRQDDAAEVEQLAQARIDAEQTIRIRAAEVELEQAQRDLKRLSALAGEAAVTTADVEQAKAKVRITALAVALARSELEKSRHKHREAEILVDRMRLVSPIGGRVEKLFAGVGEAVNALAPVVRVVKTDTAGLLANVSVPVAQAMALRKGQPALMRIGGKGRPVRGKVARIETRANPASGTVRVEVEMPNPTGRPAGERVTVSFPQAK